MDGRIHTETTETETPLPEQILLQSLEAIKVFGFKNSGYGYSCARMAEKALKEYYESL